MILLKEKVHSYHNEHKRSRIIFVQKASEVFTKKWHEKCYKLMQT
jgi:hypothetical protein